MTNSEIIDSRELLSELRDLLKAPSYDYDDDPTDETYAEEWSELDDMDRERVQTLREVLQELPDSTVDGRHSWGCTLVREDYFVEYAQQYAEDVGAMSNADRWPTTCIDWSEAADELAQDYTSVELDGVTYLAR